ncbi:TRAP transporter small permease subunit [Desulfococcus sp.]|uniref:TRAP transporter small permease subunit n=1 Tax=Desulfococcus sp. TaxID=2025834 RepID=UPI003593B731
MAVSKRNTKDSRWLYACTSAGHCVSMLFLVMIVTLISVEIFIRTVFQFSTFISEKPLIYFLTAVIMMGAAQILKDGSRIRRTSLFSPLNSKSGRLFCMAITAAAIAVCSSAFYQSVIMLHRTYRMSIGADFTTGACLFILQAVIPIGFLLFDFQLIAIFFKTFRVAQRV